MTESLINARQAANCLSLPYYWFRDRSMRAKYRIPHLLLVGVVRFRSSDLQLWATSIAHNSMVNGMPEEQQ